MLIKPRKIITLFFFMSFAVCYSQKKQSKLLAEANQKFEDFSFIKARQMYQRLIEKGFETGEVYAKLGDTYFFNSDYSNALKWYAKLIDKHEKVEPEYNLRYSICLRASGEHEKSLLVMKSYYTKAGKIDEAIRWDPKEYYTNIAKQSGRYTEVTEAGINKGRTMFGAVLVPNEEAFKQAAEIKKFQATEKARIFKLNAMRRKKADANKFGAASNMAAKEDSIEDLKKFKKLPKYKEIIYATDKDSTGIIKRRNNWSQRPFVKLYTAQITEGGTLENEKKLPGKINGKYDQSTATITQDGLTMYFTRLVEPPNHKEVIVLKHENTKKKKEIGHLKIFEAKKINGKWDNIKELGSAINKEGSSSAHPALSPDDKFLYFVSNRGKKFYDTDIYVINRNKSGRFLGKAKSVGEQINTFGKETFPYVDGNGILYFSSDSHPGLGGLDVFAAIKNQNGKYIVVNAGEPINSDKDDFCYTIDSDTKKGFFSSNRGQGKKDVLYKFLETKSVDVPFKLDSEFFGTLTDTITGKPLKDVEIIAYNEHNDVVKVVRTNELGMYSVDLASLKKHSFEFKKDGYEIKKIFVDGIKMSEKKQISVSLFNEFSVIVDGHVVELKDGDDLTDLLKIATIYFDYGGYDIRKTSKSELDKVVNLVKNRPSISLELRSHTDSRGRDAYNMELSKNRARTAVEYIMLHAGIPKERIWGKGFGETQLVNKCSNGVDCTDEEHQLNRRCEFIVRLIKK